MTQELVFGVLLTGLMGLIWAMTVSLLWGHRAKGKPSDLDGSSGQSGSINVDKPTHERRTITV